MYNIFENPFYDIKPAPNWAFTVEFQLSEELDMEEPQQDFGDDPPPQVVQDIVKELRSKDKTGKAEWEDKLSKAVAKIPIKHPTPAGNFEIWYPGYHKNYTGRYDQSGTIDITFNDNVKRDIRYILENLMYVDGADYSSNDGSRPSLPPCFYFDMIVRVYDVDKVNQYHPTDGADEVAENGTVRVFKYEFCYVNKIGQEQNSYEGTENVRTVEASIVYQRMTPLEKA